MENKTGIMQHVLKMHYISLFPKYQIKFYEQFVTSALICKHWLLNLVGTAIKCPV